MAGSNRLLRRNGTYYYRRRVPLHLVEAIGKRVVQYSLKTTNLKEAKRRREVGRFTALRGSQGASARPRGRKSLGERSWEALTCSPESQLANTGSCYVRESAPRKGNTAWNLPLAVNSGGVWLSRTATSSRPLSRNTRFTDWMTS
jgi:hypothetical protein